MIFPELDENYQSMKRISGYRLRKFLKSLGRDVKKCERCGDLPYKENWWSQTSRRKNPITVHHKDGNPLNNHPDNLILLCLKCHALQDQRG